MNHDPASAEVLFLAAAEIAEPHARAAFVEKKCGDDHALRARIEALLTSHYEAGAFLEPAAPSPEMELELARLKPEEVGERIGHYKLLQQIGEGGFGVVWMAEQEQPVRRRVALKIIKLGMDTKEVIARFEQERQALAMMDHPNIAKVFDAGATPFGRPYFVMELVRGIKITDYCDQASLPTADRLQLFIAVCQAVQHAHQKGIIHRDLKPSNILVTLHDGVPVPKVIDFGVAKAMQARLTERTLFTQFEQMIGTPLYMSPEQAEMSGLDIDTRSDIYSLGVLLYELLTGRTPVDQETMRRAGLDEIRRIIREQEPPRPSMALQTMAAATRTAVAGHRHVESPRLIGLLRGDLDWIVMKSLEKDRSRRYDTANGLAMDIKRHLENEPVLARPPSTLYRFRRMVTRNKLAFAAGTAIIVALLIGGAVSTVLFFKEKADRERAIAAEQRAEREAATANRALTELKKTAPTLLKLADSEASFQRFGSALEKLDAAIALDPTHLPCYWRRGWLLIGMDRPAEAAAAIRLAQQKDPAHGELATILPSIEQLATMPPAERWPTEAGRNAWNHLVKVGASGETVALSPRLNPGAEAKVKLVRQRLEEWLGKGRSTAFVDNSGMLLVQAENLSIDTVEPLRGLPIDALDINRTNVANVEPLHGMRLVHLGLGQTKITDLTPLIGMPLSDLGLNEIKNLDLSPLRGLPLERITCGGMGLSDFSPLRGAPLKSVDIARNSVSDLSFLLDAPLENLDARTNKVTDLLPLRGKPLKRLIVSENKVSDLSPLRGAPIIELSIHHNPVTDLAPLLDLPKLEQLRISNLGKLLAPLRHCPSLKFIAIDEGVFRPVTEFWKEYDENL